MAAGFLRAFVLAFATLLYVAAHAGETKPSVFLLKTYDGSQNVAGWVMSEKLDGVRGLWDGARLVSRGGNALRPPAWFTRDFPPFALDGELWTKRGDFENIVSIVRRKNPDARWSRVRYFIFEAPHQAGGLNERLAVVQDYLRAHPKAAEHIQLIRQIPVADDEHLRKFLAEVSDGGGEGVVVRDPTTPYQTGRLASALKVKRYLDAECVVEKILPGKGKYHGQMGALQCRMVGGAVNNSGNTVNNSGNAVNNSGNAVNNSGNAVNNSGNAVKIGSGFTDKLRANPPPPGSVITFKYYGLTEKGKPRFPVYLRRKQ